MAILVTGSTGFLGHHVGAALRTAGHKDLLMPSRKELNLLRPESVGAWFERHKPGGVIHLAANCGGIGKNMREPASLWRDNLLMGVYVLEAARVFGVHKVILVGTTCSYGKDTPMPFKESDLWLNYPEKSNAAYGISKRALLEGGQAYRRQFGISVISLIPTNLYGPEDSFDPEDSHVIPALIRKIDAAKDEVTLWGTGRATRDFLYADDCARAIVLAYENYDSEEPMNIGSGHEISIAETAVIIAQCLGKRSVRIKWDASKPDGQPRRMLDTSRAKARLGWEASTPFVAGLQATIKWWRAKKETEVRSKA